jgi:uncharacterized membrane protein
MNIAVMMLVIGIVLALVSLLADPIGIGSAGFGWKQITGVVIGVVLAVIGGVLRSRGNTHGPTAAA